MKKGDVVADADDDDDEVRTSASQNSATARLSTEEFLRTQYCIQYGPVILTKFLKIHILHVVLDWQKTYKIVL